MIEHPVRNILIFPVVGQPGQSVGLKHSHERFRTVQSMVARYSCPSPDLPAALRLPATANNASTTMASSGYTTALVMAPGSLHTGANAGEVQRELADKPVGSFVIRRCDQAPECIILSYVGGDEPNRRLLHERVVKNTWAPESSRLHARYWIESTPSMLFESLAELVRHCTLQPVLDCRLVPWHLQWQTAQVPRIAAAVPGDKHSQPQPSEHIYDWPIETAMDMMSSSEYNRLNRPDGSLSVSTPHSEGFGHYFGFGECTYSTALHSSDGASNSSVTARPTKLRYTSSTDSEPYCIPQDAKFTTYAVDMQCIQL